jgi:hypothetical protein
MSEQVREALEEALVWIEAEGHAAGCSGRWPPHRCKCRLDEMLAQLRDALAAPEDTPDPEAYSIKGPCGCAICPEHAAEAAAYQMLPDEPPAPEDTPCRR